MKRSKIAASVLAVSVAASTMLTGCTPVPSDSGSSTPGNSSNPSSTPSGSGSSAGGDSSTPVPAGPTLEFAKGTELRMATGYNTDETGLFFVAKTLEKYNGTVTLADGKSYQAGDLKPTWVAVEEKLGMKFVDKYSGKSAKDEYNNWKDQLDQVDMLSGTAALLSEGGIAGQFINLADHLDEMPNFKAYLQANPIVRLSITADVETGAMYFSPYFDGVNDIERMPLMRTDWVEKLLNGPGKFEASSSDSVKTGIYTPYMPTSGKVPVDVVKKDGSAVEKINKDYDKAGNIVQKMNEASSLNGVDAVNMLRDYIDQAYDGYYGENRADLFVGQNAAWDADELVALLRCVVANSATLNKDGKKVAGLFSREEAKNQRRVDMFRFAGHLFGVRGLESRQDYLYVGNDGKLHDARQDEDTYKAMDRMNAMAQEGLISSEFLTLTDADKGTTSADYLANDAGFMHYDYNQTQTAYNQTKLNQDGDTGEKYMAAMVPVARWNDGTGEQYFRFTESWRSVKTDGWAISKSGVGDNKDKLNAALQLIDYAYSEEGQILMSYGPEAFRGTGTFNFNGKDMPVISDKTYEELWAKESGNYTNYARKFLGSTLTFAKSQAFEFQCTTPEGKEGAGFISVAIAKGTIKHPELAITDNKWYTSVPTVLPSTEQDNAEINSFTELGNAEFGSSNKQNNLLCNIIAGKLKDGEPTSANAAAKVTNDWNGKRYLEIKNTQWDELIEYFNSL